MTSALLHDPARHTYALTSWRTPLLKPTSQTVRYTCAESLWQAVCSASSPCEQSASQLVPEVGLQKFRQSVFAARKADSSPLMALSSAACPRLQALEAPGHASREAGPADVLVASERRTSGQRRLWRWSQLRAPCARRRWSIPDFHERFVTKNARLALGSPPRPPPRPASLQIEAVSPHLSCCAAVARYRAESGEMSVGITRIVRTNIATGQVVPKFNYVFLGAPGVGKGTFAARVATRLEIPAISTGDIIRKEIKNGTALGEQVKAFSNAGKLVPDEIVTAMVKSRLAEPDAKWGFILDGYPRTIRQAEDLDAFATISLALNISLPEHVLMAKMLARRTCGDCGKGYNLANIKEGDLDMPPLLPKPSDCSKCHGQPRLEQRADDTEAVVRDRLVIYNRETAPLIEYFKKQGKLQDFAVKRGLDDTPRLMKELGIE